MTRCAAKDCASPARGRATSSMVGWPSWRHNCHSGGALHACSTSDAVRGHLRGIGEVFFPDAEVVRPMSRPHRWIGQENITPRSGSPSVTSTSSQPLHPLTLLRDCAFHHIEPRLRRSTMSTLHRLLSSGGRLSFFENNPWNPGTRMMMRRIPFDRDAEMLSPRAARRLLLDAGFSHVAPTSFSFTFPGRWRGCASWSRGSRVLDLAASIISWLRSRP